jgi:hypothetical protein
LRTLLTASLVVVVIGSTAYAGGKQSTFFSDDVLDFEFSAQEKSLESSYGFSEDIHNAELVLAPEPKETKSAEAFKEIEDQEIDDNFNVVAKRKPAVNAD